MCRACLLAGVLLGVPNAVWAQPPGALNVRDFGALGDGQTDDTAAFQAALDAARDAGSPVYAPGGDYLFTGSLRVPTGVTLMGTWQGPPSRETGTVLLPTGGHGDENGTPFITLEGAAAVQGLVITYPRQVNLEPPPIPYPWTIRGLAQDCQVRNLLLVRPWQAIDFGTFPCSRHLIDGVFGSPLRRGIFVDGSIDVGRINNVHFSTFFFPFEGPLDQWKKANGEAFIIGRADWEWITNCFAIGYGTGFRFISSRETPGKSGGIASYVAISHCGIDLSGTPLRVEECAGLTVSQCVFKGLPVQIAATNAGPVKFSQCWFSPVPGTGSLVEAAGAARVSFQDCTFEFWDTFGVLAPALRASCGSLSVQGCEFGTDNRAPYFVGDRQKPQIELTPEVQSAVVRGNRLRYGAQIVNHSEGDVIVADDVTDDVDAYQPEPPATPPEVAP